MNKLFLLLIFICPIALSGQVGQGSRATIMVVPWTTTDEDLREKLESDFNYRTILNEIRLAFDKEGYTTINFVQKLRNAEINKVSGLTNWRTIFKNVIDNSGADIIIEAEIFIAEQKYGNSVEILLEAIETSSSESLTNSGLLKSEPFATTDMARLVENALDENQQLTAFLNLMTEKFNIVRATGRSILLRVEVDENSPYDLETFIGQSGDYLSEKIQDWILDKCQEWYRNGLVSDVSFNVAGRDPSLLSYDFVRIPFKDANGDRYDINSFARELRKAISAMGVNSDKGSFFRIGDKIERNKLFLTLRN
ncbi:DUF6175 family protein [Lewinella cohaerens]|uniref:DUF6175 family protein n=1 Tax=Lewinella cohaerens TaxID=70995 RepID=UPI0003813554|nr:DUF6175 family protein [Lewinella cohaerens]